jgi:hypothetical protein
MSVVPQANVSSWNIGQTGVPGVGRILGDVRPGGEPRRCELVAVITQLVHAGRTAVKLRRKRF